MDRYHGFEVKLHQKLHLKVVKQQIMLENPDTEHLKQGNKILQGPKNLFYGARWWGAE